MILAVSIAMGNLGRAFRLLLVNQTVFNEMVV